MAEDDAEVGRSSDARPRHEIHLLERERLRAHLTRVARPQQERDNGHGRRGARLEQDHEHEREQDQREREVDVHQPHNDVVPPPAEVAREQAQQRAYRPADRERRERNERRRPRPVDHPAQNVAPQPVGAERMAPFAAVRPRGGQKAVAQVAVYRIVGRDDLGENGGNDEREEQDADGNDGVAPEERPDAPERSGRGRPVERGVRSRGRHRGYAFPPP